MKLFGGLELAKHLAESFERGRYIREQDHPRDIIVEWEGETWIRKAWHTLGKAGWSAWRKLPMKGEPPA